MERTIDQTTRIIDTLQSNQILVCISDSTVSPIISNKCIILKDKSITAIEEVVMCLDSHRVQLVIDSEDEQYLEVFKSVVSYSSSMLRPISVNEVNKGDVVYSVYTNPAGLIDSRIDCILATRIYQVISSIGLLPRVMVERMQLIPRLEFPDKVSLISTIDFLLGNSNNMLKDFTIRDLAYILTMLLVSTDIQYISEKLSYIREDAEYVI